MIPEENVVLLCRVFHPAFCLTVTNIRLQKKFEVAFRGFSVFFSADPITHFFLLVPCEFMSFEEKTPFVGTSYGTGAGAACALFLSSRRVSYLLLVV
jgi:hypothetical protein